MNISISPTSTLSPLNVTMGLLNISTTIFPSTTTMTPVTTPFLIANITSTLMSTTSTTAVPLSVLNGGSHLKFREDGVREPPQFLEASNLIIMIIGLSLLIVPVLGFLVCMCAKSGTLRSLKGMKLIASSRGIVGGGGSDGSQLPYSQFDSEPDPEDYDGPPRSSTKSRFGHHHHHSEVTKDVRVLINNDNTVIGSPSKNKRGSSSATQSLRFSKSSHGNAPSSVPPGQSNSDYATLDVDATFVVPSHNGTPYSYT